MVQADGDQQTVQESVDTGANSVQTDDSLTSGDQNAEQQGPHDQQSCGDDDGDQSGSNGNEALAGEEGQEVRQLDVPELVVADSADDTSQDAGEGVGDLGVSQSPAIDVAQGGDDSGSSTNQVGDHQPGDQTSQTGGTIVLLSQANGSTDGEQDSHVVDQGAAGLDQEEADGVSDTGSGVTQAGSPVAAHHVGGAEQVAQTHQDTTDGQGSNGQHQGAAELLQIFHHKKLSS